MIFFYLWLLLDVMVVSSICSLVVDFIDLIGDDNSEDGIEEG